MSCCSNAGRANCTFIYIRFIKKADYCPHMYMHEQNVVTCEMREILIDWLVEVHFLLGFKPETLHLAVSLVDRLVVFYNPTHPRHFRQSKKII